jgi:hypothetical protein
VTDALVLGCSADVQPTERQGRTRCQPPGSDLKWTYAIEAVRTKGTS